jgi:hypothetical protein
MGTIEAATLARSAARAVGASAVAAVVGWSLARLVTPEGPAGAVARAIPGMLGLIGFTVTYGMASWGLQSSELEEILGTVRRRLGRPRGIRGSQ